MTNRTKYEETFGILLIDNECPIPEEFCKLINPTCSRCKYKKADNCNPSDDFFGQSRCMNTEEMGDPCTHCPMFNFWDKEYEGAKGLNATLLHLISKNIRNKR